MKFLFTFLTALLISFSVQADRMTAVKSGCAGCHLVDKSAVGPSMQAIAKKYSEADVDSLVKVVKAGRKPDELTWGKIPMPASGAPEQDVRKVINWMLTH